MSVKIENVELARGTTPVLQGVSFEVPQGTLAAVLGMSGAGKTTLLRCLAGLDWFDKGSIEVEGFKVEGVPPGPGRRGGPPLRGRVGLVFQSFELFPHLRVIDNCVLAPMKVKGEARETAEARSRSLLEQLGLGNKADAWPDHLSGGQRQRVAIARALAMEPKVLLYDEPTSALDPSLKNEVAEALRRVRGTGVTQIVVTHDVPLARDVMELVVVLDKGKVAEAGAPKDIFENPRHEATKRLLGHAG